MLAFCRLVSMASGCVRVRGAVRPKALWRTEDWATSMFLPNVGIEFVRRWVYAATDQLLLAWLRTALLGRLMICDCSFAAVLVSIVGQLLNIGIEFISDHIGRNEMPCRCDSFKIASRSWLSASI